MDHHFTGFLQLRNDTIQTVPAFSNAEVPFYLAPFTGFLPFQFLLLLLDRRICVGLPKFGPIQMDSVFLAVFRPLRPTRPPFRPTCPRNESNLAIRVMSPPFRGKSPVQTTIFSVK
jgi:hypothetical protein